MFRHFFNLSASSEELADVLGKTAALVNQLNSISGKCMDRSETILLALNNVGYPLEDVNEQVLESFFHQMDQLFIEYPPTLADANIPEIMYKRKNEFTYSILSNTLYIRGISLRHFFVNQHMQELFSFDIYSDEVNMSKPSRLVYQLLKKQAQEHCGIPSSRIMHLGDNPVNDIRGAVESGLRAGLIDKEHTVVNYFES